jgi:hypothetical protein
MRYDASLKENLEALPATALQTALAPQGHNTPTYDSLPYAAFGIPAGAAGAMMLAYWFTFGAYAEAAFMVAISTVYVLMFVGTPYVMARLGEQMLRDRHGGHAAPNLRDFLDGAIATWTGPMSGWSAMIQVTLIPVGLAFATIGICLAITFAR